MADENIIQTNIVATSNMSGLITDLNRVSLALTKLQEQLLASNKSLTTQISAMNRTFAETLRSTGQFSTHFVSLRSDVDKFGQQLDKGQLKLGQFFRTYSQHTRTTGGLIRDLAKQQVMLQNAILQPMGKNAEGLMQYNVHIPRGLDNVKYKTAIARQELMIMNRVVQEGANQLINWGKNTQWAGRQLTVGLTVPMAAFGKAAADAFKQADEQLTRLTKVYGGLAATSATELAKVRKDVSATASELSKSYGASFNETLGLAADIAATGKEGNELLGSIKETTRLAVLGEVDRQEAMKATLAIQSAFKANTEDLANSINFLNAVENQTSTTLNDLVEAIPKAGPVIKGLGGSVQDLALYLTAMREGGISASEGANALKSALASLINPTKVAVEKFQGFGIDLLGIVSDNAGNVTKTILALQAALDQLDPLQKQQAIEQLFGKFQFSRLNALFENLGRQGSQTLQVLDLMKASTTDLANIAGRELTAVTESASGRYRRALEGLKADLAGVGEQFLKISTSIINIVDGVIKFVDKLPGPIKQVLTFMGILTATAGPLIMLTGVLGNFFGYIIKGVYHFKSLFKGAEGWKLLTPEILAANKAGDLAEQTFYSDAKAAAALKQALDGLTASYTALEARINSGVIGANPLINNVSTQMGVSGREVDPRHPLLSPKDTRSMSHLNPVSGMTTDQRLAQTLFGTVPGAPKVNQKIGGAPQIYATEDLPPIPGLTRVGGVSTGVVAEEAAKWHAMTGALAMQSKEEIIKLKSEVAATGLITDELSASYQALLPEMTRLTSRAAQESAEIVAQLQAGKLTVDQARAKIIALNAEIEAMMASTTGAVATGLGRTVDVTKVPLLDQPIVDPRTGKSNMKELLKPGRTRGLFTRIAQSLGVKTYGAPYSIETTRPRRLMNGEVQIQKYANGYTSIRAAKKAAEMLRAFSRESKMFSGTRTPNLRGTGSGSSTNKTPESGLEIGYGHLSDKKSKIYNDPWLKSAGVTPTIAGEYLVHAFTPGYQARTKGLPVMGKQSAASIPAERLSEFGLNVSTAAPYLQVLPSQYIKNSSQFNNALKSGKNAQQAFRPVTGSDMVSLLLFLRGQGVSPNNAKVIADRAANVLNQKILSHTGPIDEVTFGKMLNNASVRAIASGFRPNFVKRRDPFGYDSHTMNRGYEPAKYANGVTQIPGYGGGDIVPALLEPGESVITKTGTRGNEGTLSLINQGYPVDKMLGFQEGVVDVDPRGRQGYGMGSMVAGMGLQGAGFMVGGEAGTAMMLGGTAMQMAPAFSPIMKSMKSISSFGGLLKGIIGIVAKLGTAIRAAFMFMTGPVGIAIGVITGLTVAFLKLKKNAEEAGKANRLAFGGTQSSYASVGVKNYKSLTDRLKEYNEQLELNRAKIQSTYESYTKSGPNGITFTIKELTEAVKNAKTNQKEYVDAFNNIDASRVTSYAASLKAQFVAMGLSASDAANQIYAILKASDKAAMALEAVSSVNFKNITDRVSALGALVKNLSANLGTSFNAEEFARGIDSLVNGAMGYAESLVGTKNANGEIIDQNDALVKTIEQIGKLQGKNNELTAKQLLEIKKVDISYANILGTAETLQSVTAKILLYQSGMSEVVNLAAMGAEQAIAFAKNMNIVQDTMKEVFSSTGKGNPLSGLANALKTAQTNASKATAALNAVKKFDKAVYEAQIERQQKLIKEIEKERQARLKLLDVQERAANFETDVKSAQIRYQEALAAGDMAQAAQEQLNIQRLTSDRQRELAREAINNKYDREREKAEKEIERLQAIIDNAGKNIDRMGQAETKTNDKAQTLEGFMSSIQTILLKYVTKPGEPGKVINETDRKAIQNIINEMKKSTDKTVQAQAKELEAKYTSIGPVEYGGTQSRSFNTQQFIGDLNKYLNTAGGESNKQFGNAVDKFSRAVAEFAGSPVGQPGGMAYRDPVKGEYMNLKAEADKSWMLFVNSKGKKIAIMSNSNLHKDIYAEASSQGWMFTGYSREGMNWAGILEKQPKGYDKVNRTKIPKAAEGGKLVGPGTGTSDSMLAMVSNGEYVINARSAQNIGYPVLDTLNKFASGGMVKYDIPKMNAGGIVNNNGQSGVFGDTITMGNIIFNMNEVPKNAKQFGRDFIEGIKLGDRGRVYRS